MEHSLTITCIDPRMPAVIRKVLDIIEPGNPKTYCAAATGGSLQAVDEESGKIERDMGLVDVKRVNLIDHVTCAAYKAEFGDQVLADEINQHVEGLRQAARKLRDKFPSLEIRMFLLDKATPEAIEAHLLQITDNSVEKVSA